MSADDEASEFFYKIMEFDRIIQDEIKLVFEQFFMYLGLSDPDIQTYRELTFANRIRMLEKYSEQITPDKIVLIKDIQNLYEGFVIRFLGINAPMATRSEWLDAFTESKEIKRKAYELKQEIILDSVMPTKSGQNISDNISPMVWTGTQADLARIYDTLHKAGLISISSRDFSKHFLRKNGKPMPEDYKERKTTNQDEYSKKPAILGLQKAIPEMKLESGEY